MVKDIGERPRRSRKEGRGTDTLLASSSSNASNDIVLLAGGNPQIAKAYGNEPVQTYIAAMPGWKSNVGKRLDELIFEAFPEVEKAIKWNSPLYGTSRDIWFLGFHCLTSYVKVAFFQGSQLSPIPPGNSKQKNVRYFDIHESDRIDPAQFMDWVRQASRLPGERM